MHSPEVDFHRQQLPVWRYGLAVVLGLIIGLIPKESAICYMVAVGGLILPISLPTALVSAVIFSFLGQQLDSITDPVGFWLLTQPGLGSMWQAVDTIPGSAWMKLNNSVVVGSIVVAGISSVPVLVLANWLTRQIQLFFAARPTDVVASAPSFVTELE